MVVTWLAMRKVIDAFRSYAPGFIFTTAIPPMVANAARASIAHLSEHNELRTRLAQTARTFKRQAYRCRLPRA